MKMIRNPRSGQIMVLLSIASVLLLLLGAAMVDWIYIFTVRARLVTAVDASAMAATRELVSGATLAAQQATVDRVVDRIFHANFPDNFLMAISSGFDPPTIDQPSPGRTRVQVSGHAVMPTFFLRIVGKTDFPISVSATAVRQDSNVMLVLDRSGSMGDFGGAPWDALQSAVPLFVNEFSEQNDRFGTVFYSTNPFLDYTIQYPKGTKPFKSEIQTIVEGHSPGGWTNIAAALYQGYDDVRDLADADSLNVLVLFSDGILTALTNQFPVRSAPGAGPWCVANGAEPATPRWGTLTGNGPEGPFKINQDGQVAIDDCFQAGGAAYTGEDPQAENLILNVPVSWTPLGETDVFSIYHSFNAALPSPPIPASSNDTVTMVGENLALNIANQARNEGFLIYTIGLGPGVDGPFMEAIANDPDSAYYDSTQPSGEYIFADDSDALIEAFLRVASAVVHITQ